MNRIQGRFPIIVQNSLFVSGKVYFLSKCTELHKKKKKSGNNVSEDNILTTI